MIKGLKERYLTWRTGKTTEERAWLAWYDLNVNYRANTITGMFANFKHLIRVDPHKFTDLQEPMCWVPCKDARQYFWPNRPIGACAVWRCERVIWDQWTNQWVVNSISDEEHFYVATNNDRDALMITLKYMS